MSKQTKSSKTKKTIVSNATNDATLQGRISFRVDFANVLKPLPSFSKADKN